MPLTDTSIRALRPKASRYVVSDTRGLSIEVYPTGGMVWHYRYRLQGKQERITFGKYPDLPLKLARIKRDEYAPQVGVVVVQLPTSRRREDALAARKFHSPSDQTFGRGLY